MDIKLTSKDKKYINDTDDVYEIMQRILLRENKIDREKEHFWIIGLDQAGYILYIELVSLGGLKSTTVEPMNVFRVAVMKNAAKVIAVHNHPANTMKPSEEDKDVTDRLIQVGRILDIKLDDHLIISTSNYTSFRTSGLMEELEKSLKYVPTYQIIEQVRKQEQVIAREALLTEQYKTKEAQAQKRKAEKEKETLIIALVDKGVSAEDIAKILDVMPKTIKRIIINKS